MKHHEERFSNKVMQAFTSHGLPKTFQLLSNVQTPEILLYDEIGMFGVTAKAFQSMLTQAGDGEITVRINSPGGDVFDALSIYNSLQSRKTPVTMIVDGLAASAASLIAMAGTETVMMQNSMMMIHNSRTIAIGDRHDMASTSEILAKVDGQLAQIYASKTGSKADDMSDVMDKETWLTSTEALNQHFINRITSTTDVGAMMERIIAFNDEIEAAADQDSSDIIESMADALSRIQDLDIEGDDGLEMANVKAIRLRRLRLIAASD